MQSKFLLLFALVLLPVARADDLYQPSQGEALDAHHDAHETVYDALLLYREGILEFGQLFINTAPVVDQMKAARMNAEVEAAKADVTAVEKTADNLFKNAKHKDSDQDSWTACWSFATWTFMPVAEAYMSAVATLIAFISGIGGEQ
jgi:hypothetical protein